MPNVLLVGILEIICFSSLILGLDGNLVRNYALYSGYFLVLALVIKLCDIDWDGYTDFINLPRSLLDCFLLILYKILQPLALGPPIVCTGLVLLLNDMSLTLVS